MSRFAILLGGDLVPTPFLDAQLAGARVIAADSGMRHAETLGLAPELWVGDFDSVTPRLVELHAGIERRIFPAAKDQTDGEIAVAEAIARGATELVLAGAFGGPRVDHEFLHLSLAVRLAGKGYGVILTSGRQEGLPLLPGTSEPNLEEGTLFSILAFSVLSGLTVSGARWPLDAVEVPFGSSLTLSNEVRGRLRIVLGSGRALLVAHRVPVED